MRSLDWSSTPLGAPQGWPPALTALVGTILPSKIPMLVAWGPQLVAIYNDAYTEYLGDKHPAALGQRYSEIWSEIWTELAPVVERGWAGQTTFAENRPFLVKRRGYLEHIWATFSHSPIFGDGAVVGALDTGVETTEQVLAEKRRGFQLAFVDELRGLARAEDITVAATRLLGQHLDVSRAYYVDIDDRADAFHIKATWQSGKLPALPQTGRFADYGPGIIAALRTAKVLAITDTARDATTAEHAGAFAHLRMGSILIVPLVRSGHLIAALNLAREEPSRWSDEDVSLTEDVAERTWAAVERAQAEAALDAERDRSRDILQNMDEGFVLLDRDFRVRQINAAALRFERRQASEILGRSHWDVWPGTESSQLGQRYKRAMGRRVPLRLEHHHCFPDGRGAWLDVHAYPQGEGLAVFYRDITERKRLEQERYEAGRRLELAVEVAQLGAWEWEVATGRCHYSPLWKRQLGYEAHELGSTLEEWRSRLHPDDRGWVLEELEKFRVRPEHGCRGECRLRHRDGTYRWMIVSAVAVAGQTAEQAKVICTQLDITEHKLAEQRVVAAAQHDPLTGLPSRALVFEYAAHVLAAARRNHAQGAFLFIDLDRFKPINDLYGHQVGDRLLQEVARRLLRCVRDEDLVGRLGGDEFIVVLQHVGTATPAATVAQHVLEALSRPFEIDALELSISASVGISHFPLHGTDVDALVHAADLAMYRTKQEGRGNFHIYTPELNDRADASSAIEARLKRALKRDGFALHYQPVIDMKSRRVIGVEALLRLQGEDGRLIGPNDFVPVAESAGLITALGEWVLTEACRQHEAWLRQGLPAVTIAVNVSPLQFRQRGFGQRLQEIVRDSGMSPACIQIEVTESTVMESVDEVIQTLHGIRSSGMRVALDDFGTGYSSLSHLGNLPLDKLKVDQSFVQRLGEDRPSRAITEAIIALGRTLSLEIVGEGIESEEALAYLQEHGCDQAQGYFISPPLPAGEFARWYGEKLQ